MPNNKRFWAEIKGTGTGPGIKSWSEGVMKRPTARQVAELEITHGIDACQESWWYVAPGTIRHMISEGKRALRGAAA